MLRSKRRVSASFGALTIALASPSFSFAQESLPTIEIGKDMAARDSARPRAAGGEANGPQSYTRTDTSLATRTDTPIMKTPVDVVVVPQQVLKDQQVITIDDAVQNVSSVYATSIGGLQSGYQIRGFDTYKYFIDGVRVENYNTPIREETADVEQVEVLKGPASILYGRINPGGIIELTTKKPLDAPYYSIQQQIGSFANYRTTLDATGPLTADKSILYRFNAAYENDQSFRELVHSHHIFLAPRIHWEPSADTRFDLYLRYLDGSGPLELGTPLLVDGNGTPRAIAPISRSRNYGEPGSQFDNTNIRVGFKWTHDFSADWSLTHRFDANFIDNKGVALLAIGPFNACGATSCTVERMISNPDSKEQNYYTSVDVTGHFSTFGLAHTLLAGTDLSLYHRTGTRSFNFSAPSIDLYNPVHTGLPLYLLGAPDWSYSLEKHQSLFGLYLQDQIELPYNFHVLAGFRYDNVRSLGTQTVYAPSLQISSGREAQAVIKPRVGLLWQPIPEVSLFGDYVEGFTANIFSNDSPYQYNLPPEEARQWEAGVKTSLWDGRLTGTVAWFDIEKINVPSPASDPISAALGIQVPTGAVRNRGVDVDASGQLTPELKFIGSFSYLDARIVKDDTGNKGNRFYGAPRFSGSVWGVYEPQYEPLRGLAIGAGVYARGDTPINNGNTFLVPGYATVNFMTRYSFAWQGTRLTLQLNINNLLDKTYYQVFGGGWNVSPQSPRAFTGSLKVEF
ncbi:TonB-dependent siderophore receptor [Methylosinus sporium]|uniref:TonB-dependent siderophore receptor n=1 Tax=Methylosinus sporium TaxID=428 RepID=UPI00383AC01F